MADEIKIETELTHENGTTVSQFSRHLPLIINGASVIDNFHDSWSPLHLLIAGLESCFFLTFLAVAEKMRIEIKSYSSKTDSSLASPDGKHKEFGEIVIRPIVTFANAADKSKLEQIVKIAKEHCPVANSLKTKVRVEI